MSSCWTRSILSLINTQENTHFRITAIALSVSPRSMTGHFPTGGYAITIIYLEKQLLETSLFLCDG